MIFLANHLTGAQTQSSQQTAWLVPANSKNSSDEIPEQDIALLCYPLAFNVPNGGVLQGRSLHNFAQRSKDG